MSDTGMKAFLVKAVERAFTWHGVEGVSVGLMPSFRFEDNGMDGKITLFLAGDLKCSAIINCEKIKYARDPMHLLESMRRMVEGAMTRGEMADDTPLDDVVSRLSSE